MHRRRHDCPSEVWQGVPFNRLEQLQEGMGIPLPASTQWDIVEKTAMPASIPLYQAN